MQTHFMRSAVGAAVLTALACGASAQNAPAQSPSSTPAAPTGQLKEVVITGNPLGASDLVTPATSLAGTGLLMRRQSTLGETLDGLPGVSSTYFGPNASRPVIRGMDGDRIRVLNNGGASIDASSLSFDHAVPADPLAIERVEVLRGPAALMYGGSATGGVVNVIDTRIAREPLFDSQGGVTGRADLGLGGAARERGAAALVEGGNDRVAVHADVFRRSTADTRAPADLACTQAAVTTVARRICNSRSESDGGAFGTTVFFDRGYLGGSISQFGSQYGTVAEDEVRIDMKSRRMALEGELRDLGGFWRTVKAAASHTNYTHTEFDAGVAGTTFNNAGTDFRLEARHARSGPWEGVFGLQTERSSFSADGAEAFAPYSRTRSDAVFGHEELRTGFGKLTFGVRAESVKVESLGHPTVARFATGSRSFRPGSAALGALVDLAPRWQLTSSLASTSRAPRDYELYADGPHIATNAYEVGNPNFGTERSTNLDLGVNWKSGPNRFALSAFTSRFSRYLTADATGVNRGADGEVNPVDADGDGVADGSGEDILPEYAYRATRARFNGLEASGNLRLLERGGTLDLELRGDLVRATDLSTGQPLPRIAPTRLGATLAWASGPFGARLGFTYAAAQNRVPAGQLATPGWTLWNAAVTWKVRARGTDLLWYARLDNATDRLAYSASSILTQTAPGKSPLPGRSFKLGLQANF